MFWKKSKKSKQKHSPHQNAYKAQEKDIADASRIHSDSLGDAWRALTGQNPAAIMPQIIGTVLHEGGTRPPWQWRSSGQEYIMMAWPQEQPVRAAILMGGPEGGQLKPITATPLLEGVPNDLTVEEIHPRKSGMGADVAVSMVEGKRPMWFFDPFYGRDKNDLTPGVTHTFWLAGLAFGIRKALLDYVTLTQGPDFQVYAGEWLKDNPGKTSADVPPLKVEIKDKHFIMPGRFYGEYQLRAVIDEISECQLEKMPVKLLYLNFPFDNRPALRLPLYASDHVLGSLKVEKGMEIEAYGWLQGRIIDLEQSDSATMK